MALLLPNIKAIFGFLGLTICNYDGFIIPTLMKIKLERLNGGPALKVAGLYALCGLYVVGGLCGLAVLLLQ